MYKFIEDYGLEKFIQFFINLKIKKLIKNQIFCILLIQYNKKDTFPI